MAGSTLRTRMFACAVFSSLSFGILGCFSNYNPVRPPPPDVIARSQGLPEGCRRHLHILVINGFDPSEVTNALGLAHFLEKTGFPNVYYTPQWQSHKYVDRICEIKASDPQARIAVVAYSMGVCYARKLARCLKEHGITLDLLICLDIFAFNHSPDYSPDDARQIVNIITEPRLGVFGSELLPGAKNIQFLGIRHVKVPTEPCIIERVLEELRTLAESA
jgi:hypothetical protein